MMKIFKTLKKESKRFLALLLLAMTIIQINPKFSGNENLPKYSVCSDEDSAPHETSMTDLE